MHADLSALMITLKKCVVLAVIIAGGFGLVGMDVLVLHDTISEISFTEIGQETVLFCTAVIFWICARRPGSFGFGMLIGGFFGSMFVRELDHLFDLVFHGFWILPAIGVSLGSIYAAWGDRAATLRRLAEFTAMPTFGLMLGGLSTLLIFSRLFGMSVLWEQIFAGAYVKVAKHAVEEGTETLGYCLCFSSALEYFRETRQGLARVESAPAGVR